MAWDSEEDYPDPVEMGLGWNYCKYVRFEVVDKYETSTALEAIRCR